ncbi:hypothetical protein ACB092_08G090700 [Castanea dentata]
MICELFAFLPRIIIFLVGVFPFSHESAADHCSSIRFRVGEEAKKRQWSHCVSVFVCCAWHLIFWFCVGIIKPASSPTPSGAKCRSK